MIDEYFEMRDRNFGVITKEEQKVLRSKSVVVIGLGCVGELEAVMLARLGVGNITICDFDELKIVNLNRNPYSFREDVGKLKVDNIKRIINEIDPSIKVNAINKRITFGDEEILKLSDVIIQAIDTMKDRIIIHRMVEQFVRKPIITMSGGPPNRAFVAVFDVDSQIQYEKFLKLGTTNLHNDELNSLKFENQIKNMKKERARYSRNWGAIKEWADKFESEERMTWAVTPIRPYLTAVISVYEAVKILLKKNTVISVPNYYSINLERISNPVTIHSGAFNYYEY